MKFKIGDKVRLISDFYGSYDSNSYYRDERYKNIIGTVSEIREDGFLPIVVKWSNGSQNSYEKEHLSFLTTKKDLKEHTDGFIREDKSEKVDYTLIPPSVLEALAAHYTSGAKVHGRDNWMKSTDMDTFKQSAFRHLMAVLEDNTDEPHDMALIWNVACLYWHRKNDILGKGRNKK